MKRSRIAGLALISALTLSPLPALAACEHDGHCEATPANGHMDAPVPLLGAGIPGLAIGFGVYWLIRRRQRSHRGT